MSKSDNILSYNVISFLTNHATNYEISKDAFDRQLITIFDYYDSNKDNILQKEELTKLKSDLQNANFDQYQDYFSKKEAKNYLNNTIKDSKVSIKHLSAFISNIIDNYKLNIKNEANGEIESFEQGNRGDCWLLAQLSSLSNTTWGKDVIKNSIIKNEDENSYTIRFAGVNFKTKITQDDIQQAREGENYSSGDLDVLLFELATERYLKHEKELGHILRGEDVLKGSIASGNITLQYLLTGKTGHSFYRMRIGREEHRKYLEEKLPSTSEEFRYNLKNSQNYISNAYDRNVMLELIKKLALNENIAIVCTFSNSGEWENADRYSKKQKKNEFINSEKHAFVIKSITKDENGESIDIELTNPHYSDIPIHKTLEEFLDQVECIGITTENDIYDEFQIGFEPCIKI